MGDLLDELASSPGPYKPLNVERALHPSKEWEPRVDTEKGEIVGRTTTPPAEGGLTVQWDDLLRSFGFDPDEFTVEEPVEVRTYDAPVGGGVLERVWYYKARIRRRRRGDDLSQLLTEIRRRRPRKTAPPSGDLAYLVTLADLQIGKRDGEGTRGVVRRVLGVADKVRGDVTRLRRTGSTIGHLVIAGMGDVVEGCQGFYPSQTWAVELDRREQIKVSRRLILKVVTALSDIAEQVTVLAVPGNHGEYRNPGGKVATTAADNGDLEVFEQVAEITHANPDRYGHIRYVIPETDPVVLLDLAGHPVAFTHGHYGPRGGPAAVWRWWVQQTHGMQPAGDARTLVTAHYHHLHIRSEGPRTHIQCPPLDSGSEWYAQDHGYGSQPGTLVCTFGPDGFDHLRIL